ncbi:Outer membrane protein beta-barrel domain-containing protein [Polaribacter sp. KT25b]|uniref:outer membrane beta-barrel protein n=1 Tax=Polaribacter sp. KT25b TaxID=1855336 RepID=UPI00087D5922|nr:outer membrane beta-barrel protein [Polaribacter sp. KT25b]SDS50447.1 Outer membrane protein beta-barrel domain-containing protein [Polaribacter sp. KT25b]
MDHNNLDKLFQEQLKNLEATPNKRVWNNIESKLKKKKRRVVPVWWFASGIAAMLLLGILLFPFSDDKDVFNKTDSDIIITESPKKEIKLKTIYKTKIDTIIQDEKSEEKILISDKQINRRPSNQQKINPKNTDIIKKLVSKKNEKEKTFFADNSNKENIDSIHKKEIIIIDNTTFFSDKKKELTKVEKESITNKVDLNKFVEKKDSLFSPKSSKEKWSIAPVFAVLNSNSFSNTSPIDKSLSNSTKGQSSYSYGLQIGYKINKKWSIQSGIHLQEMSFSNRQVTAVVTISTSSSSVAFNSGDSFSFNEISTQSSDFASSSVISRTSLSGELNQQYGYIEIPIEVKYNFLSSKKFNTEIVAGFSSLFLNKNEINLESQFLSKSGKANNLNTINFSGNLGFDFNYSLNKKWSLNLNPMLKAQLHTFSENSNGFAPFNLGIYSGIKYKF